MTEKEKKPEEQQAATPPEPKKNKYKILKPGDYIARCSYILPNQLQCWKAGEEEVLATGADGSELVYQLCERHARITRAIESGAMQPESVNTVYKEATTDAPASEPNPDDAKAFEDIKQVEPVQEVVPPEDETKKEEGDTTKGKTPTAKEGDTPKQEPKKEGVFEKLEEKFKEHKTERGF